MFLYLHIVSGSRKEPSVYTHYLYDAAGNRVKKYTRTAGGNWETITYLDGLIEYREDQDSNLQSINHVMDDSKRIATIREGNNFGDTTPAIKYNLDDHLGSSNVLVDDSGTLVNQEEYYPFGETSFGAYAKKRYHFCGKEKDEESGMYYYGARYYSHWLCRFISVDPMAGDYPFYTPFQYAGNQPINFIDLDGKEPASPQGDSTGTNSSSTTQPAANTGGQQQPAANDTAGTNINCHTVKSGETLGGIAKKHGTTVSNLKKDNPFLNNQKDTDLAIGTELSILPHPAPSNAAPVKKTNSVDQSKLLPRPPQTLASIIESKWSRFATYSSYSRTGSTFVDPFNGKATITSNWLRSNGKKHGAYDFGVSIGTPIYNPANGQLAISSTTSEKNSKLNYGNYMVINHGVIKSGQYSGYTLYSLYGHLNTPNFSQSGMSIQAGQMIGTSGNTGSSTGPHLHWEIFVSKTNSVNLKDGVNFPNIGKTLIHPNQFLNLYYSTLRK